MNSMELKLNPFENAEDVSMFFTFSYNKKTYVVSKEEYYNHPQISCSEIKWNPLSGTHYTKKNYSDESNSIALMLLDRAEKYPKKYSLTGEHYTVRERGQTDYVISRSNRCVLFDDLHMLLPLAIRMIVAIAIGAAIAAIFTNTYGMSWARAAFPSLSTDTLKLLLTGVELVGVTLMYLFKRNERSFADIIFNALIPINTVTMIGIFRSEKIPAVIIGIFGALLLIYNTVPKVWDAILEKRKNVRKSKIHISIRSLQVPLYACVFVSIVATWVFGVSGITYKSEKGSMQLDELTLSYYDAQNKIAEDVWCDLDMQERIDVLQIICTYECEENLGCESPIVQTGYLTNECLLGKYNSALNSIVINEEHLQEDDVYYVLETLLHETRHAWQQTIADMYDDVESKLTDEYKKLPFFETALKIRNNLDLYYDSKFNYDAYHDQTVEKDSRNWSEFAMLRYEKYIYPDEETTTGRVY